MATMPRLRGDGCGVVLPAFWKEFWSLHPANSLGIELLGGVTMACNIMNVNDMDGLWIWGWKGSKKDKVRGSHDQKV